MTRYELIKQHAELFKKCEQLGVTMHDWESVEIYEEILRLCKDGFKMTYAVWHAAEVFNVNEMRVWRIVRRMREKVTDTE